MVRTLFASVLALALVGEVAHAQAPGGGYPSYGASPVAAAPASHTVVLDVPHIPQDTDVWCWAAVSEMVITYLSGTSPDQCRILEIGFGLHGQCCGNEWACRTTGSFDQMAINVRYFAGGNTIGDGRMDERSVMGTLGSNMPIIAGLQSNPSMGHVVVIRGFRTSNLGLELYVNDPLMQNPFWMTYAQFATHWQQSLIVTGRVI